MLKGFLSKPDKAKPKAPAYRFTVGTRVLCRTGDTEWSAGEIVALTYSEPSWPPGKIVPYQVQLDDGRLIFVPLDRDELCRKLKEPWWKAVFDKPGSYYAKNNPSGDPLRVACIDEDVNEQDHRGHTALMEAIRRRWSNGASQLIGMKADVNVAAADMTCALHIAVAHGKDIVKLLVDAKANVNCQDTDPDYDPEFSSKSFEEKMEHRTPLHYACLGGDVASAKLLLESRAQPNIQDAQLKTPLHLAIDEDMSESIDLLLSHGADVNLGDISSGLDNSCLMNAAFAGKTELVAKLIAAKADINKQGKQQMSALHLAARSRRTEVAAMLLAAKADMNQESKCGTALQLARKNGGADLLKAFGVQPESAADAKASVGSMDAAQRAALFMD